MKKLTVKSKVLIIGLLLASLTGNSFAQRGPRPEGERQGPPKQVQMEQHQKPRLPNLSSEQDEQLKNLHLEMEKAALPIRNQIGEKEARLISLSSASEINLKEAGGVIQSIADLQVELRKLELEKLNKVKQVLTEEQELIFMQQLSQRHQRPNGPARGPEGRR